MAQTEDIFEARLKRLKTGAPKALNTADPAAWAPVKHTKHRGENSYLLPVLATTCLIAGATAFSTMLMLPQQADHQLLVSDAPLFYVSDAVIE